MNYYNPYFYTMPTALAQPIANTATASKVGLLSRIFGRSGATLSSILNGTQKVLNVANQAIPLVKQAKPMVTNAKTMFKIMNEFKRSNSPRSNNINNNSINSINSNNNTYNNNISNEKTDNIINSVNKVSGPTFFA